MTSRTSDYFHPQVARSSATPTSRAEPPSAYRIQDACYQLGIGRTSLYELVKRGEIKLIKIAGRTLVPRSEIERLTMVEGTT